jgi:hypothetical protein
VGTGRRCGEQLESRECRIGAGSVSLWAWLEDEWEEEARMEALDASGRLEWRRASQVIRDASARSEIWSDRVLIPTGRAAPARTRRTSADARDLGTVGP